jgi:tetratricopeptide (TPR) repeat protein
MGLAEQGKVYALGKDFRLALYYYRKAMQLAVEHRHPEIFFRHYLECVIEALEHQRGFSEVLDYCQRALALYAKQPATDDAGRRDLAHIYQRLGVTRLKLGEHAEARVALRKGIEVLRGTGQTLPLAQTLLRWLDQGIHVDERRVSAEQERTRYFSVRKDTVAPERALRLPDEIVARECPR